MKRSLDLAYIDKKEIKVKDSCDISAVKSRVSDLLLLQDCEESVDESL